MKTRTRMGATIAYLGPLRENEPGANEGEYEHAYQGNKSYPDVLPRRLEACFTSTLWFKTHSRHCLSRN